MVDVRPRSGSGGHSRAVAAADGPIPPARRGKKTMPGLRGGPAAVPPLVDPHTIGSQPSGHQEEPLPSRGALLGRLVTAVVLLGLLGGAGYIAVQWEPRLLPIRIVTVEGEMQGLSRQALQETIGAGISGGILTQDLMTLQQAVEALPWVDRASVRRLWPDRIEVQVSEHEAVARWGENGLVTAAGVVFRPRDGRLPPGLALLEGADDSLAPKVVTRFFDWGARLTSVGLVIDGIRRDARGDWTIQLLGGIEVLLGTGALETRLQRLLAAYPQVEAAGKPARIDLRYSNGFAVRWVPTHSGGGTGRVAASTHRHRS
ncbi:MAG: FtsQ-type POTRA domain-containing protein [Chromatiaceae bacterium]|nr:MAG: FtsQ-type POTRA domain-containing protein [Chromatiaceae bacterium]